MTGEAHYDDLMNVYSKRVLPQHRQRLIDYEVDRVLAVQKWYQVH